MADRPAYAKNCVPTGVSDTRRQANAIRCMVKHEFEIVAPYAMRTDRCEAFRYH